MDKMMSVKATACWHKPAGICAQCGDIATATLQEVAYWRRNGYASMNPEVTTSEICAGCCAVLDLPLCGVPACLDGLAPVLEPLYHAPLDGRIPEATCPRCEHATDPTAFAAKHQFVGGAEGEGYWFPFCCCCGQELQWVIAHRPLRAYDEAGIEADDT